MWNLNKTRSLIWRAIAWEKIDRPTGEALQLQLDRILYLPERSDAERVPARPC